MPFPAYLSQYRGGERLRGRYGFCHLQKRVIQSKQEPAKKIALPEHCRLCFGALQNAIAIFNNSLNNNQPPGLDIPQQIDHHGGTEDSGFSLPGNSRDAQNDILHSSSRFCSHLKKPALATKNAAIQYPDAMRELQDQNDELYKYMQQFRAKLE